MISASGVLGGAWPHGPMPPIFSSISNISQAVKPSHPYYHVAAQWKKYVTKLSQRGHGPTPPKYCPIGLIFFPYFPIALLHGKLMGDLPPFGLPPCEILDSPLKSGCISPALSTNIYQVARTSGSNPSTATIDQTRRGIRSSPHYDGNSFFPKLTSHH